MDLEGNGLVEIMLWHLPEGIGESHKKHSL
jgi:hypothetical protein